MKSTSEFQTCYLYLDFASVCGPTRHPGAGSHRRALVVWRDEVSAYFSLPCVVMARDDVARSLASHVLFWCF